MHFNYYFLRQLSAQLGSILENSRVEECYSQQKDELILRFSTAKGNPYFIKANLDNHMPLLSFPENHSRARKNSVDLFKKIISQRITKVVQFKNERAFSLQLEKSQLIFKLFGKMANIILCEGQDITLFKTNLEKDLTIDPAHLDRDIDQSIENLKKSEFNITAIYPTFDKNIFSFLDDNNFEQSDETQKQVLIDQLLKHLETGIFYIYQDENKAPYLTFFPPKNQKFEAYKSPVEACNALAKLYYTDYLFQERKRRLKQAINSDMKRTKSYIKKTQKKLHDLQNSRKYDELANILMANLHVPVKANQKSIELHDFYTDHPISIRINPDQSLQLNAENYYRKSKNQSKEVKQLEENLRLKQISLDNLNEKMGQVESTQNSKELKALSTKNLASQKNERVELPFSRTNIAGFEVLVGKNAKNNDLLTLKYAKKNDLWLHAKDVSGSHVVVRSHGDDKYPKDVIERAAQLAAWHSKRQHDTLCPVIYTLKKYVNKPKGFAPGMVRVLREDVVLVTPKRSF